MEIRKAKMGEKKVAIHAAFSEGVFMEGFLIYPEERKLTINQEHIYLTAKEAKLLAIFAAQPNEEVERSRLQKEVWEDGGVIIFGRSLDVFVSRFRKNWKQLPASN
jgi:DNA-binding response OmpR family regulator